MLPVPLREGQVIYSYPAKSPFFRLLRELLSLPSNGLYLGFFQFSLLLSALHDSKREEGKEKWEGRKFNSSLSDKKGGHCTALFASPRAADL